MNWLINQEDIRKLREIRSNARKKHIELLHSDYMFLAKIGVLSIKEATQMDMDMWNKVIAQSQ